MEIKDDEYISGRTLGEKDMEKVKMVKLEDGNYIPKECCTINRCLEVDDVNLPCGVDCREQCSSCVIQKVMNAYGESGDNDWIPVAERLPEERDSIFAKIKGTDEWKPGMFEKVSRAVLVTVEYPGKKRLVEVAHTTDGKWKMNVLPDNGKVIAWRSYPAPYKEE
jgi:hypothetical protein